MADIIYILTNEAMPGLVKIGVTNDNVEARMTQLSSHTGIPLPFECYFAAKVDDAAKLEKTLHQIFAEGRINPKREFFRIDPEKVVLAISIGNFEEVTPGEAEVEVEEKEALEKEKAGSLKLKLEAIGITAGHVITFSRDENVKATVVEGGKVSFEDEVMSPSAAALKALHRMGYKTPTASGSENWMFEGELLDERRRRLEAERFDEVRPGE